MSLMDPQTILRPECLVTVVARDADPLEMFRLNVILDRVALSLFPTDVANISLDARSVRQCVLAFLHHRPHRLLKLREFSRKVSWISH